MKTIYTIILLFAFSGFLPNDTVAQSVLKTESIKIKVKGIGCKQDVKSIQTNVQKLPGVKQCEVVKKGATTTFEVSYDPEEVQLEKIYFTVEDTPGCKNPKSRPYKVKDKSPI